MPPKQIPGPARTTVSGSIDSVPCPHCGKRADLRDMRSQQLLDTGHKFLCDHCGRSMEVTSIRDVTVISVRKSAATGTVRQGQPQIQRAPQNTIGGAIRRLLGGPKR